MKKIKYYFILFIIMMFITTINVDAAGVSIKSIKLVDHTGNSTEINEPTSNGLNINFDLAFGSIGDTVKYEVVLNNSTNHEYEINTDKQFSSSNYISYSYELKDKTNRIKANSEVTLFITVKYENVVPSSSLVNGQYIENNGMGITLLNENNPNTYNNLLLIVFILLMLLIVTLIIKYTKKKELFVFIFVLLIIPATVFALESIKLTINTKIMVGDMYNVYYYIGNNIKASEFNDNDYISRNCRNVVIKQGDEDPVEYLGCDYIFKKDSKSYFHGQRVKVKPLHSLKYDRSAGNVQCIGDGLESPNIILSDVEINNMFYFCVEPNSEAFNNMSQDTNNSIIKIDACTKDEFNSLNFQSTAELTLPDDTPEEAIQELEALEQYGLHFVVFDIPNEFTMPNHDMFFLGNISNNRVSPCL